MRSTGVNPDRPKKLTMRRIREICSWKVFDLGKDYYDKDEVTDVVLERDGTLTGTVLEDEDHYIYGVGDGDFAWYREKRRREQMYWDYQVTVALDTGKWRCSCPYSQVDICSHVAAVLIHAAKEMRATVPADDLPMHPRSVQRTTSPYRDEAYRILTRSDSAESAKEDLNEFLELAVSCSHEGDHTEAVMICLGITEALILGLDYQAYSTHFLASWHMSEKRAPPSTREPEGMDAMRVCKFWDAAETMRYLLSGVVMQYEKKVPCLMALHRLFVMTNPWGPSEIYSLQLILTANTDKDWELVRRLHDPTVPADTPDWREDPIGFRAAIRSAEM